MIGGVHYLITRGGSRPRRDGSNDCREPPYPVRGGCTRLLFLERKTKQGREGNASITCEAIVASALERTASSAEAAPSSLAEKRSTLPLVGRGNWVNPTEPTFPVSERTRPPPRRTRRVHLSKSKDARRACDSLRRWSANMANVCNRKLSFARSSRRKCSTVGR